MMNTEGFEKHIKNRTPLDVSAVYEALKDKFSLTLTSAYCLENGKEDYDEDHIMLCGSSSLGSFQLYDNGMYGVFDTDKADGSYMHWHPHTFNEAIKDVTSFMQGDRKVFLFR